MSVWSQNREKREKHGEAETSLTKTTEKNMKGKEEKSAVYQQPEATV